MRKYLNIKTFFAKAYLANWSGDFLVIKNIKNTVLWTYAISDLNGKEIIGIFYKKELQKQIRTNLE